MAAWTLSFACSPTGASVHEVTATLVHLPSGSATRLCWTEMPTASTWQTGEKEATSVTRRASNGHNATHGEPHVVRPEGLKGGPICLPAFSSGASTRSPAEAATTWKSGLDLKSYQRPYPWALRRPASWMGAHTVHACQDVETSQRLADCQCSPRPLATVP